MWHCSVDAVYQQLDTSAVAIAQLVAQAADESILCVRGGDITLAFLVSHPYGWQALFSVYNSNSSYLTNPTLRT